MIYTIPTFADPFYSQITDLEGTDYLLTFRFNQREACWYLSLATADGSDIYNGIKIVCGIPLLRKCADARKPPGALIAVAAPGDQSPPGLAELGPGLRVELTYYTADELHV